MKYFKYCLFLLVILFNLILTQPSFADQGKFPNQYNDFQLGQRVIWLYKAHASYGNVQQIPGEVVKIGSKEVQIKVKKKDNEFVKRWVSRDKLLKLNN